MNILTTQRTRHRLAILLIVLCGSLGLSSCSSDTNDSAEQIQAGANALQALAGERFQQGWSGRNSGYFGGGPQWADDFIARMDDDRFPDWASGEYDACIYWERNLSYSAMNRDRQPGEPSQFVFEGKSWGWILMKDDSFHILELGLEFDGDAHLFIDAWMPAA